MFSDVFRCFQMFSIAHRYSVDILSGVQDVFRCSKMFSDDHRICDTDVLGLSLDVF